jgi:NTE family protein
MDGKDKSAIPKNSKKVENQQPGFKHIVSEGSIVVLDARDLIKDTNSIKHYSWKQTAGIPVINDLVKDSPSFSFTAPYVKGNDINTRLTFELITKDADGKTGDPYNANVIVKRVHRAIIFQGGVALGAYEAGVFQALVEKLVKNDEDKKRKGLGNEKRPLFDIVAGASIGAMNGAIVVSSVMEKGKGLEDEKNWETSAKEVIKFWGAQQYQWLTVADNLDMNPLYHYWRDILHYTSKVFKHSVIELIELYSNMNPSFKKWYDDMLANWLIVDPNFWKDYFIDGWYIPATAEAARRYYSAKQFLRTLGPPNVATGIIPWSRFSKFFDFVEQSNSIPRPDNKHFVLFSLKRTLERFAHFPIKTKEGEPRLLLVTVDVQTGDAVTFDSYSKEAKYHDDRNIIYNEKGIEIEHALATGTFPDFFDYPKFRIENPEMGTENEEHIFWDGGFRSNTPLREVIQAHRDYWLKTRKKHKEVQEHDEDEVEENNVPDLEIYIADLWPSKLKEEPISFDRDFVENRKWDLLLADKTHYDEQIANVVTDYVDLAKRLKNLAEQKGASKAEINYILNSYASSINTIGKTRIYKELLQGRFRLTKVVRIDRKDDGNEVHDKVFDYSYKTIEDLMNVGYQDASVQMDMQRLKEGVMELAKINGRGGIEKGEDNHQIEQLKESLRKIEERMKIENGYNTLKQVKDFINEVESIEGVNENKLSLKEEKALLIAAAKQLQNTINMSTTKNKQNLLPHIF